MRDFAGINELICLSNLKNINAVFINEVLAQNERLQRLNTLAHHKITLNFSLFVIQNSTFRIQH